VQTAIAVREVTGLCVIGTIWAVPWEFVCVNLGGFSDGEEDLVE
jgi:hypothetical protein